MTGSRDSDYLTYTERGSRIRVITARRATTDEQDDYYQQNRQALEPLRLMSEAEVMDAALSNPDAKPLMPADFKRMRRVPRAKIIRRAPLTHEQFADCFHISLGTLRDSPD